ncbi:nucleoporin protein Ndc1-Nup [Gloeopeniophorella convolvens]|nr:nucleoporin protein Ndc1-Nup [Gloeopeniophorella convolvens]
MAAVATPSSPSHFPQPVRAITSTLSTRAAPSIPPASQTYEPLARAVLRRRFLYDILLPSILPVWASAAFWKAWGAGGLSTMSLPNALTVPFLPAALVMTAISWALGVLPIVVLRKSHLTAVSTPSSSPSQRVKVAFSKPGAIRALFVYVLTAIFVTSSHVALGRNAQGADHLDVFVRSRKHHYYLNGRFLFLLMAQIAFASAYYLRSILLDRPTVRWAQSKVPKMDPPTAIVRRVVGLGVTSSVFTLGAFAVYIVTFGLVRAMVLPILLQVPAISRLLRPFLAHFLRGRWSFVLLWRNRALIWQVFLLGLTTVAGWEYAESLFDDKVQEPLTVASHTADPALTLISGITSDDPYYVHFGYIELCAFAEDDSSAASTRRTTMFGDQKHTPTLWATLLRSALLTLGKDYQTLLRRGAPPPPMSAPAAPKPKPEGPAVPATPLVRKPVFKTAQSSPLHSVVESLASDSAVTQAIAHSVDSTAAHLPDLFKSTSTPAPTAVAKKAVAAVNATKPALLSRIQAPKRLVPPAVQAVAKEVSQWWTRPRASRIADGAVPNRETDILIAEVLSRLVCASLAEDRYGVVQRDIPRVLEALLSFLTALEEAQRELIETPSEDAEEAARAVDVYGRAADAMKEGVVRIVQTFGNRLTAFRFPPHIAQKLQGFVDYH